MAYKSVSEPRDWTSKTYIFAKSFVFRIMAPYCRLFLLVLMLLVHGTELGQSVRVEFYKEENYNGFVEDKILSGQDELQCVNLKYIDENELKSVKSDKCLIMYSEANCSSVETNYGWGDLSYIASSRIEGNTPKLPAPYYVGSFHVCSQKLGGGPQLDLDVFGGYVEKSGNLTTYFPKYKEAYRGVCGCRNFPSWVSNPPLKPGLKSATSINNGGNSVNLYAGENCQGQLKYVPAGQGPDSWTLADLTFKVKSFKPAELKNCYRLDAKIHKFYFTNGTQSIGDLPVEKVQLATSADIYNNGASEITQTYKLSTKSTNTVEFSVADSFTQVHSAGVEAGVEMKTEVGVPLIAKAEVTASLKANYQFTSTGGGEKKNTTTTTTEEGIEIQQEIKIPACRVCTVTTSVKKVKGFVIKYKAYANVKAPPDAAPMSVEELRSNLPAGLPYVRTVDEHTVEAVADGEMNAEFGVKSIVDVNCVPIAGCLPKYFNVFVDGHHQIYEFPIYPIAQNSKRSASGRSTILSFAKKTLGLLMPHLG